MKISRLIFLWIQIIFVSLSITLPKVLIADDEIDEDLKALEGAARVAEELAKNYKVVEQKKEKPIDILLENHSTLAAHLIFAFHSRSLTHQIAQIMVRLAYKNDPEIYSFVLTGGTLPFMSLAKLRFIQTFSQSLRISDEERYANLVISLGLFAFAQNEDEVAAMLAHRMAKFSPRPSNSGENNKLNEMITSVLKELENHQKLDDKMKTQIFADLQAVDRLIKAGYNPWALYNIQKRISSWVSDSSENKLFNAFASYIYGEQFIDLKSEPIPELRMIAIKAYIFKRGHKADLALQTEGAKKFSNSLKIAALKSKIIAAPFLNPKARKSLGLAVPILLGGYGLYYVGVFNPEFWASVKNFISPNSPFELDPHKPERKIFWPLFWGTVKIGGGIGGTYLGVKYVAPWLYKEVKSLSVLARILGLGLLSRYQSTPTASQSVLAPQAPSSTNKVNPISAVYDITKNLLKTFSDWSLNAAVSTWHWTEIEFSNAIEYAADTTISLARWTKNTARETPSFVKKRSSAFLNRLKSASIWSFDSIAKPASIWTFNKLVSLFKYIAGLVSKTPGYLKYKSIEAYNLTKIIIFGMGKRLKDEPIAFVKSVRALFQDMMSNREAKVKEIRLNKEKDDKRQAAIANGDRDAIADFISILRTHLDDLVPQMSEDAYKKFAGSRFISFELRSVSESRRIYREKKFLDLIERTKSALVSLSYEHRQAVIGTVADMFLAYPILLFSPFFVETLQNLQSFAGDKNSESKIFSYSFRRLERKIRRYFFDAQDLRTILRLEHSPASVEARFNFYFFSAFAYLGSLLNGFKDLKPWQKFFVLERIFEYWDINQFEYTGSEEFGRKVIVRNLIRPLVLSSFSEILIYFMNFPQGHNPIQVKGWAEDAALIDQFKLEEEIWYSEFVNDIKSTEKTTFNLVSVLDFLRFKYRHPKFALSYNLDFAKIVSGLKNFEERAVLYTISRSNSNLSKDRKDPRVQLEASLHREIESYLSQEIKSIRDIVEFVKRIQAKGAIVNTLTFELYNAVFEHPEWIQTKEDVELLTTKEYFWPTRGLLGKESSKLEAVILSAMQDYVAKYPKYWSVEPAAAEALHLAIIKFVKANNVYNQSFDEQFAFWLTLSERGVTAVTDSLFEKLYATANAEQKKKLEESAVQGRVWDQPLKVAIVRSRVFEIDAFKRLLETADQFADERLKVTRRVDLSEVVEFVQKALPEKGLGYVQLLEEISNKISSSAEESSLIQRAKYGNLDPSDKVQDLGARILNEILSEVLSWDKYKQWKFILFLRGDEETDEFLRAQFGVVGPERIRRLFQLLPIGARAAALDSFLSSHKGIVSGDGDPRAEGPMMIINHLLKQGTEESREIGRQILEAFLYSLQGGNTNARSSVLAYLLALLKQNQESSVGQTLKHVLETFGVTGVKIGQILAASEVLGEKESSYLFELQDQAKIPDREDVYAELRDILNKEDIPFKVHDLLGAASLKYAVRTTDKATRQQFVLKVLREEAQFHTTAEFMQLDRMADFLVKNYGAKYGLLRAIIKAAKKAVERELSLKNEARSSQIIAEEVYSNKSKEGVIKVKVPSELPMTPRLLASVFAPGGSFRELPEESKSSVAREILTIEGENLLREDKDLIWFDPDRHAGNYRIRITDAPKGLIELSPIDFGQVVSISKSDRLQLYDLFTLAQFLKNMGSTVWASQKVAKLLNLDKWQQIKIHEQLNKYFEKPNPQMKEVSAYYTLLAALEDAGHGKDMVFFDFVRGLVQLTQYKKFLKAEDVHLDPHNRLKSQVEKRSDHYLSDLKSEILKTDPVKGIFVLEAIGQKTLGEKPKVSVKNKCLKAIARLIRKS